MALVKVSDTERICPSSSSVVQTPRSPVTPCLELRRAGPRDGEELLMDLQTWAFDHYRRRWRQGLADSECERRAASDAWLVFKPVASAPALVLAKLMLSSVPPAVVRKAA